MAMVLASGLAAAIAPALAGVSVAPVIAAAASNAPSDDVIMSVVLLSGGRAGCN
jgi:hypothetical protein